MELFPEKKLIVVSNREPYSLSKRHQLTVGGLVSALDPLMKEKRGLWIASGQRDELKGKPLRFPVPLSDPSYTLRLVPLGPADTEGYYNGYSNRFLWPLCHITLDRVYLRRSYWRSYRKVNSLFAEAVAQEAGPDSVVWLHDYHLALCALFIKELCPDAFVSIFWHIPWPPHAVFRICPQKRELLEGLLANDLIGFQLPGFMENFAQCVRNELGAVVDIDEGIISHNGRLTRLRAFPISVDFEWFERAACSAQARRFISRFLKKRGLEGSRIILSVNRLDYTKGMIKCLEAVELFFTKYPRYKGSVTFVQIAVPTRKVEPYLSYMERVQRKVDSINKRLSRGPWRPVEYVTTNLSHSELAALYRKADLAMISSVYDGMNLVAKEFIASQVDLSGSLLISELAGASEEIPGVTLINPYDTEGCAMALKAALEASPADQRRALEKAREHVREHNITQWVADIFREIKGIQDEQIPSQLLKRAPEVIKG